MTDRNAKWLSTDAMADDLAGKAVRAGSWAGAAQVARALVEVLATVVLARLLLPKDFGLVGMVVAVTGFLGLFKDLGLSTATIQREDLRHEDVSSLFWLNVGGGLAALSAGLAPVLAWFYGEPLLTPLTLGLAGTFLLGSLGIQHHALLRRNLLFGRVAVVDLSAAALGVGAGIVAAILGAGVWALVIRVVVSELVAGVTPWLVCDWRPGRPRWTDRSKELIGFGGNLTGFSVVNYFARNVDDVLVGRVFGAASLGFYQKAYEILMLPLKQVNAPVGSVAIPALSRLDTGSERYKRAYLRILEKLLLVTSFVAAFLIMTADWAVVAVLGDKWAPAAPIFAWLGLLVFTQPLGNTTGWLFITQDRTRDMLHWGLVGSGLSVASFVAGAYWGAVGVAAAYSVSGVLVRTPAVLWWVTRRGPLRMRDFAGVFLPFVVAAAGVVAVLWALRTRYEFESVWSGLGVSLAAGLTTYALLVAALPSCRAAAIDAVALIRRAVGSEDE